MLERAPNKGHSDWSHIARVKQPRITMPIFGNGDIDSPEKALKYKMNMVSTVS
jgi:tRNA-dihydrouridine synthase